MIRIAVATVLLLPVSHVAGQSLVVTNKQDATASIISLTDGRTMAVLPTGQGPHEVAVSSDGSSLWSLITVPRWAAHHHRARRPGRTGLATHPSAAMNALTARHFSRQSHRGDNRRAGGVLVLTTRTRAT